MLSSKKTPRALHQIEAVTDVQTDTQHDGRNVLHFSLHEFAPTQPNNPDFTHTAASYPFHNKRPAF